MALDHVRIQNKLVELGQAGPFYACSYANRLLVQGAQIQPQEVLANQVGSAFGAPERNRRAFQFDRVDWTWELRLGFGEDAIMEAFEKNLNQNPIQLPANKAQGERQISLSIASVQYQHAPQQGAKGFKVVYLINARLWPL